MNVKKQYLKTKPICKVTFSYPENGGEISNVKLVGEFNQWDTNCSPMKKNKSGEFTQTIELEPGREYQYRYLVNEREWVNDPGAEKYTPNEFASENSVVVL